MQQEKLIQKRLNFQRFVASMEDGIVKQIALKMLFMHLIQKSMQKEKLHYGLKKMS